MDYTDEEILTLFRSISPSMQKAIHDIMEVTSIKGKEEINVTDSRQVSST